MLRLCSESSRPYPGRSARYAAKAATGAGLRPRPKDLEQPPDPTAILAALLGAIPEVIGQEVSRGHSRRRTLPQGGVVTGNEPGGAGKSHPAEGPNSK